MSDHVQTPVAAQAAGADAPAEGANAAAAQVSLAQPGGSPVAQVAGRYGLLMAFAATVIAFSLARPETLPDRAQRRVDPDARRRRR